MRLFATIVLTSSVGFAAGELFQFSHPALSSRVNAGEKILPKPRPLEDFSLELPKPDTLFRTRSEEAIRQEINASAKERGIKKTEFPLDAAPIARVADFQQLYPPRAIPAPTGAVCFRALYFQDVTRERDLQSWRVGEPLREAFRFYSTALALPAVMLAAPPWRYQCWHVAFVP